MFPGCRPVSALLSWVRPRPPGRGKVSAGEGVLGEGVLGECAWEAGAEPASAPNVENIWGVPPSACRSPLLGLCLRGCPGDGFILQGAPHGTWGDTQEAPPLTDSWTRSSARCFLICRPLGEKPLQGNQDAALISVPDPRLSADMHAKGQGPGSAVSLVHLPLGSVRVHGAVGTGAET